MYRELGRLLPVKFRENYKSLLKYSRVKVDPDSFVGFILFFSFGLALSLSFYIGVLLHWPFYLVAVILFFIIEALVYMGLMLKADSISRAVERILPDALQLMSSNLRAGMTTDRALLLAARDEFGYLQYELNHVGKEIAMGKDISDSLLDMSKRIKSEKVEKTVLLIVSGLKSGGGLSDLLDQTAKNLRDQKVVEEKVKSNVLMYVIFIFIAVGIGAPMLFGLSSYLVQVITKTLADVEIPDMSSSFNLPFVLSKVSLSETFILTYALVSIITSAIMGSFVIGLIQKGREREGLRFLPILLALCLGIFFLVRVIMTNLLGGLFGLT